jgi:hypothetical protein
MRQDPVAIPRARNEGAGFAEPLAILYREAGLAAVAVELHLHAYELSPEVAEAVERGAAALFLSGYGPYRTLTRPSADVVKEVRRRKAPRSARRSAKAIFNAQSKGAAR